MTINILNALTENTIINSITIPKYDWLDIASGEISVGNNILVAINGNSDKIVVSRDNGTTWENSSLGIVNSWKKIAWSPTMKRFCVIAYDSDIYMLSNPITTLTGDLSSILIWNKRSFGNFSNTALENIEKPFSLWHDLMWISGTITEAAENYNTFIVTSREYDHAFVAVIEEVEGTLDITGWKPHALISGDEDLTAYNWKDLCSTDIPTDTKTLSSPQFVAIGTNGNLNSSKIAVSTVEHAGNAWTTYNITDNNWLKVHYHPALTLTNEEQTAGAISTKFTYFLADNGDICYTAADDFNSLTYINETTQPANILNNITTNSFVLSNNVISQYILNANISAQIITITVADDTARLALTLDDVPINGIVKVTSSDLLYKIISSNGNNLDTEECYELYYQMTTTELSSAMSYVDANNIVTYNEIKTNLYDISQLTSEDVEKTITDLLKDIRHITKLNVPSIYNVVNVANDAARFELSINDVNIGTIVKVLNTEMLYEVVDTSLLSDSSGYKSFGIPYYNIPKIEIREHLSLLSIEQLTNIFNFMQSTNHYDNLSNEQKTEYITQIRDTTGIEGTGIAVIPVNILDGMLDYLTTFYINPAYDGTTDLRKYIYRIEDETVFDTLYADNTIFAELYNNIINDIQYNNYNSTNYDIIEYTINYIILNVSTCITSTMITNIITSLKEDLITYITTNSLTNTNITIEIVNHLVYETAESVLNNANNSSILTKIKNVEILDINSNNDLLWNDIVFISDNKKFIALSNTSIVAMSYDLLNWNYIITKQIGNFNNIVFVNKYNKYVAVNNTNKIFMSSNLVEWDEYTINTAKNINKVILLKNSNKICFIDNELNQLMYIGNFYLTDNNTVMLDIKDYNFENSNKINKICTNSVNGNLVALTESKILISNIIYTGDMAEIDNINKIDPVIISCNWNNIDLGKKDLNLLAIDYYDGNYCIITHNGNILTSTALEESKWETRKINKGLDSYLYYGNHITRDPDSNVIIDTKPLIILLQNFGHYNISNDFIKLSCKNINQNLNWKSICWSEELQIFCAISDNNISAIINANGTIEYGEIPNLSAEISSVAWLTDLNIFVAISKCREYIVSEDGLNWFKTYFNDDLKYTKIYYNILLNKTFILAKKADKIITIEKTV